MDRHRQPSADLHGPGQRPDLQGARGELGRRQGHAGQRVGHAAVSGAGPRGFRERRPQREQPLAVTWPAAARAQTYHVTYSGDNAQSWSLGAASHSGIRLTISGVDSEKTYTVGVRAQNASGYSGWRNSAPATR